MDLTSLVVALEGINETASRVSFQVVFQGVASVEAFGAKVARERPLSSVDTQVIVQVLLLMEPLGTLSTWEGSGGILSGLVVMCIGLRVVLNVWKLHFKIKAFFHHLHTQNSRGLQNLRDVDLR